MWEVGSHQHRQRGRLLGHHTLTFVIFFYLISFDLISADVLLECIIIYEWGYLFEVRKKMTPRTLLV